jgi:hypothetical protein
MANNPRRPPGRPRHNPDEVKRQPLTIRTTSAVKARLVKAAKAGGRSLAEEIEFRLGAAQAHFIDGDVDQTLAALDHVADLAAELQNTLEDVQGWLYSITLALRKAGSTGPTKLVWDEVEQKFVPRPAALSPNVAREANPKSAKRK